MRIALATCSNLPDWEKDDRPLHAALRARGATIDVPAWDDASFEWSTCDACLIRTTWDYVPRRNEFVAWADRVAKDTPLFNPPAIVRWNTDKRYLRDLAALGIATIPTIWLEAGRRVDVADVLRSAGWKRAFLKPVIGSTARETLRFGDSSGEIEIAQRHLDRLLPVEAMMIQPYLASVETEGEVSAILIDGDVTHCVRKVPVAGDYRVQDDFDAHDEPVALSAPEVELARRIVAAVDPTLLYARVDWLRDEGGELRVTELELVEPSLFFRHGPQAAEALAGALLRRLGTGAARPDAAAPR